MASVVSTPAERPVALSATKLLIDNRWIASESGKTFATVNPSTGEEICQIAEADAADVEKAVKAARAAFEHGPWRKTLASERGRLIHRLADLIEQNADELARPESLDNGRIFRQPRRRDGRSYPRLTPDAKILPSPDRDDRGIYVTPRGDAGCRLCFRIQLAWEGFRHPPSEGPTLCRSYSPQAGHLGIRSRDDDRGRCGCGPGPDGFGVHALVGCRAGTEPVWHAHVCSRRPLSARAPRGRPCTARQRRGILFQRRCDLCSSAGHDARAWRLLMVRLAESHVCSSCGQCFPE
jgi:hypothetical protein